MRKTGIRKKSNQMQWNMEYTTAEKRQDNLCRNILAVNQEAS